MRQLQPATNCKGFSLIELLIAIFFIAISMLALLTSIVVSMKTNLQNDIRDTAVRITNQTAEALLSLPTDPTDIELTDGVHTRTTGDASQDLKGFPQPTMNLRGTQQQYAISWTVASTTASLVNNKQVVVNVSYSYGGANYSNNAVLYASKKIR